MDMIEDIGLDWLPKGFRNDGLDCFDNGHRLGLMLVQEQCETCD
jgi:hypothetical protein